MATARRDMAELCTVNGSWVTPFISKRMGSLPRNSGVAPGRRPLKVKL